MAQYIQVNDKNFDEFMKGRFVVLVLGKSDCGSCMEYSREIEGILHAENYNNISFGKIVLDKPGSFNIKKNNSWISKLNSLPYTVLYKEGQRLDEFSTIFAVHLERKMRQHFFGQPSS